MSHIYATYIFEKNLCTELFVYNSQGNSSNTQNAVEWIS